jgi:hypothetical protein
MAKDAGAPSLVACTRLWPKDGQGMRPLELSETEEGKCEGPCTRKLGGRGARIVRLVPMRSGTVHVGSVMPVRWGSVGGPCGRQGCPERVVTFVMWLIRAVPFALELMGSNNVVVLIDSFGFKFDRLN